MEKAKSYFSDNYDGYIKYLDIQRKNYVLWFNLLSWLICFNGMQTHLELFYALWLENRIYCTFIFTFFVQFFLKFFWHTVLSNANNFEAMCKKIQQKL